MDDQESRLRQLESGMVAIQKDLQHNASREWVREILRPIEDAVKEIRNSVTTLTDESKTLFDAHNELLKDKAAADKQSLLDRTAAGMVRRYAPIVAFIIALFTVFRLVGTWIEVWMKSIQP